MFWLSAAISAVTMYTISPRAAIVKIITCTKTLYDEAGVCNCSYLFGRGVSLYFPWSLASMKLQTLDLASRHPQSSLRVCMCLAQALLFLELTPAPSNGSSALRRGVHRDDPCPDVGIMEGVLSRRRDRPIQRCKHRRRLQETV